MNNDSRFITNSFQVPNAVIDELMAELSGAELKCYLAILRKTKGWNKDFDAVSVTQLMSVTGLSNRAVIDACNHLVELNLLYQKTGSRGVKIFSVNLCNNFTSEKSSPVKKVHGTSEKSSPVTSEKSSHTKNNIKTLLKIQIKKLRKKIRSLCLLNLESLVSLPKILLLTENQNEQQSQKPYLLAISEKHTKQEYLLPKPSRYPLSAIGKGLKLNGIGVMKT